jgi:hypothetical protein
MHRMLRTAVTVLAALTCTLVVTSPAGADPSAAPSARPSAGAGLDAAKNAVAARIDKRLEALKRFSATVNDAKHLDAGHKTTLTKLIGDSQSGLTALRAKVLAETTAAGVRADAQGMVFDYRVFILTGPKVRLAVVIDTELAVIAKMRTEPGADQAKLDTIEQSLKGKVDALLAIAPGPDGDAIRRQVQPIRAAAKSAHAELKALRKAHK